jgi:hypothetical protein
MAAELAACQCARKTMCDACPPCPELADAEDLLCSGCRQPSGFLHCHNRHIDDLFDQVERSDWRTHGEPDDHLHDTALPVLDLR